jgi:hypothetical protein
MIPRAMDNFDPVEAVMALEEVLEVEIAVLVAKSWFQQIDHRPGKNAAGRAEKWCPRDVHGAHLCLPNTPRLSEVL